MRKTTALEKILLGILLIITLMYLYEGTDHAMEQKFFRCIEAAGGTEYAYALCSLYQPVNKDTSGK